VELAARSFDDDFEWRYFVAADQKDWRKEGLTVVTFKDFQGNVDTARFRASDVGLILVNLQIGNSDWYEQKGCFGIREGTL